MSGTSNSDIDPKRLVHSSDDGLEILKKNLQSLVFNGRLMQAKVDNFDDIIATISDDLERAARTGKSAEVAQDARLRLRVAQGVASKNASEELKFRAMYPTASKLVRG